MYSDLLNPTGYVNDLTEVFDGNSFLVPEQIFKGKCTVFFKVIYYFLIKLTSKMLKLKNITPSCSLKISAFKRNSNNYKRNDIICYVSLTKKLNKKVSLTR